MANIAIDKQELAKLCGVAEWPESVHIDTDMRAMAARAVTDFHRAGSPVTALCNAEAWIIHAYNDGKSAGIQQERGAWVSKIRGMFGL